MKLSKMNNGTIKRTDSPFFNTWFSDDFFKPFIQETAVKMKPSFNIAETPAGFRIEIAAPGFEKNDFKINIEKNILTIKAEKEKVEEQKEEKYYRREFAFGSFEKAFEMPETVTEEKIEAKYENGILYVTLPKRDEAKEKPAREIEII